MKSVSVPLHLIIMQTRSESMVFAIKELRKFWENKLAPMLDSGTDSELVNESFVNFSDRLMGDILKNILIRIPMETTEGVMVEIPSELMRTDNLMDLQNNVNLIYREVLKCKDQQDTSAKNRK